MNKIYGMLIGMLVLSMSFASANLCDDAINDGLWQSNPELFDLNEDGVTDLSDLAMFSSEIDNDSFCSNLLSNYYYPPFVNDDGGVESSPSFKKYNLDRVDKVEMSRNVFGALAREIQFDGVRYKVGLLWNSVWLVNKNTRENVGIPEGLKVTVEPRTFFTRTIIFEKEE